MICGFPGVCSRHAGHRGHHGGWRTGIHADDPGPYQPRVYDRELGSDLSPSEARVLAEYVIHASVLATAECVGVSVQHVKNTLLSIRERTGSMSNIESMRRLGWLRIPDGVISAH